MVSFVTFPSGRIFTPASDELKRQLGDTFMDDFEANPFRDYLKTMVYYNTEPDDVTGRIEHTYQTLLEIEPLWQKFKKAEHKGTFEGLTFEDHVVHASQNGDITEAEAEQLINYNALRFDSLLTDVFDEHLLHAQERINPHSLENAVHKLTDYAQLKNNAQVKNGTKVSNENLADTPTADNHIQEQTGDANPDHGYEPDGDVKMVDEQNTAQEIAAQTSFDDSHPRTEAIDNRHRDAESTLSERMSYNHNRSKTDAVEIDDIDKKLSDDPKWQDGLHREEDDKA